jgi:hypothetical protein
MPRRESSRRGVMRNIRSARQNGNKIFTSLGHNWGGQKQEPPQ